MGWDRKLREQKKWVFCLVVLLFYFNIHFPPANWVFTAHSIFLTILKAEPGEQGQHRKAAITQKDLFYHWELSGCQLELHEPQWEGRGTKWCLCPLQMPIKHSLHLVIAAGNEVLFTFYFSFSSYFLICFKDELMATENQSRNMAYVSCLFLPRVCSVWRIVTLNPFFYSSEAPFQLQTAQAQPHERRDVCKDLKSITWPSPYSTAGSSLPKSQIKKK